MKVGVISLGCAKNLVDTENLLGMLAASGIETTRRMQEADAVIINTCGFITDAKQEAIDTILQAAQETVPAHKKLIVMGCLVKRYQKELEQELPEVSRFISLDEYGQLGSILSQELGVPVANTYGKTPRVLSGKPWMAYLKIAEGCDNRCSYCAIPGIRGPLVSVPEADVVAEARRLVEQGVRELNLIAQDSSRYGWDWDGQLHLSHLLQQLDQIDGIRWIRILYLYPDEISDDLLEVMQASRHILPYFDIPVQHHNDRLLKLMHRRGSQKVIVERCQTIRRKFAHPTLRTTLITGFPSETLAEHEENVRLVRQIGWDHLGVFTYSKEENTPSWEMEDDVPEEEKQRRRQEILQAQDEVVAKARAAWLGRQAEVLIESYEPLTGMYIGRSAMFAPDGVDGVVRLHALQEHPLGTFVPAVYTKVSGQNMIAREVQNG